MTVESKFADFKQPQWPQDEVVAELYRRYRLGPSPSLEDIKPVAMVLLENPLSVMQGASLILGRGVSTEENLVREVLFLGEGQDRFSALLLEKAIETRVREGN